MSAVVDYPARDMTITVEAGMPVQELQQVLAAENQQLPVDAFDPSISVGALVASDVAGPRQYGYGTLRDYVIGIEAVDGHGRIFHAGGRVVKNVAGYDLCRLMVGSRGSLGILTQVTFKLKPVPEHSLLLGFRFADAVSFETALECLNSTAARPILMDFATDSPDETGLSDEPLAANADRRHPVFSLTIGVEGTSAVCDWQADVIRQDCAGAQEFGGPGHPGWTVQECCDNCSYGWMAEEIRLQVPPSRLAAAADELSGAGLSCAGHAGNGLLFVRPERDPATARTVCDEIAACHHGTASQWERDHPGVSVDPLSGKLRLALDPQAVFVPAVRR